MYVRACMCAIVPRTCVVYIIIMFIILDNKNKVRQEWTISK